LNVFVKRSFATRIYKRVFSLSFETIAYWLICVSAVPQELEEHIDPRLFLYRSRRRWRLII